MENRISDPVSGSSPSLSEGPILSEHTSRRSFLRTSAGVGAGLLLTSKSAIAQEATRELKVAFVGCGTQCEKALTPALQEIANVRPVAVADVWPFRRGLNARRLASFYKSPVNEYATIEELLDQEKELDAVIIATPDYVHHVHTRLALEKGLAVYCEKMMSNTIEGARDMVLAQRETGGILQIGHQRRSNPRYLHLRNRCIHDKKIFGRITHAYGQWNRAVTPPLPVPGKKENWVPEDVLATLGFEDMNQFLNWRWFRKFGGGAISDLGAHQIDLYPWFFEKNPTSVIASGGNDYYKEFEHYDNAMAIYEFDTDEGKIRTYYQVLTTTSSEGFYEKFMGVEGNCVISEVPKFNQAFKESLGSADWKPYLEGNDPLLTMNQVATDVHNKFWESPKPWHRPEPWLAVKGDVRVSKAPEQYEFPVVLDEKPHTPHLRNFLEAVRAKDPSKLNCPVTEAFRTCVTVLKINDAIAQNTRLEFDSSEFVVA